MEKVENIGAVPSYAQVLDALRKLQSCSHDMECAAGLVVFLHRKQFIQSTGEAWKQMVAPQLCDMKMCADGYAALDWPRSVERSPQWRTLMELPYE